MRRHVELRAGVAVDQQDVDVVGRVRPDGPLMGDLEPRETDAGQVQGYSGATSSE